MMQPGDFALASTVESLELADDLLGRLEGRSSIARLGMRRLPDMTGAAGFVTSTIWSPSNPSAT